MSEASKANDLGLLPAQSRGPTRWIVCSAIAIGIAYRLHLAMTLPVGYDEVYVMGVGLEEMAESPSAWAFAVPATRSSALTPLWWWVQYVPFALFGGVSLTALRLIPALLGIATILLAYRLCEGRFGRTTAGAFTLLVALSDILAFTNGRGEFAESLALPCIVVCVCMLGRLRGAYVRGVLWLVLIGLSLGKGLFVIGLVLLAEGAILVGTSGERRKRAIGLAISLAIAVIPALMYLVVLQSHFAGQSIIHHEAASATSVFDLARRLVFDYAHVKRHVTGSMGEAAIVWRDFGVWPMTVLSILPIAGGLAWGLSRLGRRDGEACDSGARVIPGLIVWALAGFAVVVGRGLLGARFHLMYLPPLWLLGAMWIGSLSPRTRFAGMGAGTVACLAAMLVAGPIRWAPCARFEPMAGSDELAALNACRRGETETVTPHGRTLYIDMANYHLKASPPSQTHLDRAVEYARKETVRVPDDARAWAYLGEALLRSGAPNTEVRAAWRKSLDLAPNARLRDRLQSLR